MTRAFAEQANRSLVRLGAIARAVEANRDRLTRTFASVPAAAELAAFQQKQINHSRARHRVGSRGVDG